MKYIKTYEHKYDEYSEGDYIILKNYFRIKEAKILEVRKANQYTKRYRIEVIGDKYTEDKENKIIDDWEVNQRDVERLMTPEEKENYKLKIMSIKYNI